MLVEQHMMRGRTKPFEEEKLDLKKQHIIAIKIKNLLETQQGYILHPKNHKPNYLRP